MAAAADGQDKVIAAAHQIVKSLATSQNAADDMMRILSGFDNRLSTMNDLFSPSTASASASAAESSSDDESSRFDAAEGVLLRWDASPASLLFEASPDEVAEYLSAVDGVISLDNNDDVLRDRAESVLQLAMCRLEDEFRHLMIRSTLPFDAENLYSSVCRASLSSYAPDAIDDDLDSFAAEEEPSLHSESSLEVRGESSSISDDRIVDLVNPDVVADLKGIADRMVWAGYGKELCQVYSSVRRDILDECLTVLGVDRMSIDEVQRIEWRTLNDMMKKWIEAVKVVSGVLLPGEKRLCDQIVAISDELKDECFTEAAKGCVMQLLNFGDAISICERSAEKLFRIVDMYEALSSAVPNMQVLFSGETGDLICSEGEGILMRLVDAVRGTLAEFGNAVRKETSRRPVQGAEIHPLTRYVMNYLKLLVDYSESFHLLLNDSGQDVEDHPEGSESIDIQYLGSMAPLGRRLHLLISYLEANLEEKSKLYEDTGMQYIFLMNNILYIVQKVKESELRTFLGDQWIRQRRGKVRQYATSYLRASWTKILSYLRDDGLTGSGGSSNSASRIALKERFKIFNLAFEEIYRIQTTWKVPDPQLREELRLSISEKVFPAYRSFVGRFGGQLDAGRNAGKYVKYTPEDLDNNLSDLFEGLPGLSNHPRRRT